jgi:hypothetical protein
VVPLNQGPVGITTIPSASVSEIQNVLAKTRYLRLLSLVPFMH